MSQTAAPYPPYVMVPMRESNGLGVAGFFISLIGLAIPTGIVALLGLLISLVALGRAPRGFAGVGVLVGLVGTVVWLTITTLFVLGSMAAGVVMIASMAAAFVLLQPEIIEFTSDSANVVIAAVEYAERNDELPADLAILGLSVSTMTDPWGNPYKYKLIDNEPGFDLISGGGDGVMGTDDDMALSRIDEIWQEACQGFPQRMKELSHRLDGMNVKFDDTSYSYKHPHSRWNTNHTTDHARVYEEAAIAATLAKDTTAPADPEPETEPDETAHDGSGR